MASYTPVNSCHKTLTTTTADTVSPTSRNFKTLAVTNHDASVVLYFRIDGTAAVSAANETFSVPAGQTKVMDVAKFAANGISVSVVGNGNAYSVEVW